MLTEILLAVTDSELESIAKEVYRKAKEAASKGRYWTREVHQYWHRSIHVIHSCCLTKPWKFSFIPSNKYLCSRKPKFKLIHIQTSKFEKLIMRIYYLLHIQYYLLFQVGKLCIYISTEFKPKFLILISAIYMSNIKTESQCFSQ